MQPTKCEGLIDIKSGRGHQVVAPPSIHPETGRRYEWITDVREVEITELTKTMEKKIKRVIKTLVEAKPIITEIADHWRKGARHNLALSLAGWLRKRNFSKEKAEIVIEAITVIARDEEFRDRLRAVEDTFKKPRDKVKGFTGLVEVIGEEAKEIVKEVEEKATEKKKRRYTVGNEVLDDGRVLELVEEDDKIKILVYNPSNGEFYTVDELETEQEIIRPYPNIPFPLPRKPSKIDEDPTLWEDTKKLIIEYYDNPRNDEAYDVMTAAIAWSYFYRGLKASTPFLGFLGPFRSGKTRALEVLAALCYRSMNIVDPSEASIFRLIEELKPTLIIDESQILNKNVRALMAAAHRYGQKIPRVIDPEAGLEGIRWFDCFAFIIYATREEPPDDIRSRTVIIHCEKNIRRTRKKIDYEKARELRTRWLAQRLRLFEKVDVSFEEFESEDGRVQEIISPLLRMAEIFGGEGAKITIERYGRQVESEIKNLEASSMEAELVEKLVEFVSKKGEDAPAEVSNEELLEFLNNGAEKPIWECRGLGRRMVALGFERVKLSGGKRGYKLDLDLLWRLAKRYDVSVEGITTFQQ